jgi:hypothetical protein
MLIPEKCMGLSYTANIDGGCCPVPNITFIDHAVFAKTSPKRSSSMIENERAFWACFRQNWIYKVKHWFLSREQRPRHCYTGNRGYALLIVSYRNVSATLSLPNKQNSICSVSTFLHMYLHSRTCPSSPSFCLLQSHDHRYTEIPFSWSFLY